MLRSVEVIRGGVNKIERARNGKSTIAHPSGQIVSPKEGSLVHHITSRQLIRMRWYVLVSVTWDLNAVLCGYNVKSTLHLRWTRNAIHPAAVHI